MSDVTRILDRVQQGEAKAADELLPLVYEELRRLAAQPAAGPSAGPAAEANERERAERLRTLRVQIDALRASLGLPVEADAGTGGGRDVGTEDQQ